MMYITKNKTGSGYIQLLSIHKKGGCYDDTKNDKSKNIFTRTDVLKDLLKEQNNLCAYCMSDIDEKSASIEHIVGQSYIDSKDDKKCGKYLDTDYNNMLAVCKGKNCANSLHCDKSRANSQDKQPLLYISPLIEQQMQNIVFTQGGKIEYTLDDEKIGYDLDTVLNLNCKTLVENRKRVKSAVISSLKKKSFSSDYAKKQLDHWKCNPSPYYQVAIKTLEKHIK